MKAVGFFTNKGGVGKTTLVCNLAGFLAREMNRRVLIVDADPQSNATQYCFSPAVIEEIYEDETQETIYDFIRPIELGKGFSDRLPTKFSPDFLVDLVVGDPRLALIEDILATDWSGDGARGLRTTFLFRQMLSKCGEYDYVFFDMGPSLGSINRSVLLACDYFLIPLSIDIFSVRAIENISSWMKGWQKRLLNKVSSVDNPADLEIDDLTVRLNLIGYVSQQYTAKRDKDGQRRAVRAFDKIKKSIPTAIKDGVFTSGRVPPANLDYQLGEVPNLHSLVPMSQTAHKPVFALKAADGVVGAHFSKVAEARDLFRIIARRFEENVRSFDDNVA